LKKLPLEESDLLSKPPLVTISHLVASLPVMDWFATTHLRKKGLFAYVIL
jgi:hypothetical protein